MKIVLNKEDGKLLIQCVEDCIDDIERALKDTKDRAKYVREILEERHESLCDLLYALKDAEE